MSVVDANVNPANRQKWIDYLRNSSKYGSMSFGNDVKLLSSGSIATKEIIESINEATTRVWLESYIFDDSSVSQQVVQALCRAKKRGCDVIVLVDYVGTFPKFNSTELDANQVKVVVFNPPLVAALKKFSTFPAFTFRDHRKLLIVDETAYVGSMNIHADTIDTDDGWLLNGKGTFHDVHARVSGPAVIDLAKGFLTVVSMTGAAIDRQQALSSMAESISKRPAGKMCVQVLETNILMKRHTLRKLIRRAIDNASERVGICSSYFFPPYFLRESILGVLKRNVNVSIVASGVSDFAFPGDLLSQLHALRRFVEKKGCDIFMYRDKHMHAKFFSVDGLYSCLGSFNFDSWSYTNMEVGIAVFDKNFSAECDRAMKSLISKSLKESPDEWYYHNLFAKFVCGACHWVLKSVGTFTNESMGIRDPKWEAKRLVIRSALDSQVAETVATSYLWGFQ